MMLSADIDDEQVTVVDRRTTEEPKAEPKAEEPRSELSLSNLIEAESESRTTKPKAKLGDTSTQKKLELVLKPELKTEVPAGWFDVSVHEWSLDLLQAMDWRVFEDLCAELFRKKGYRATTTNAGADGGIDIVAHRGGEPGGKGIAVQCKRYRHPVPAKDVREFFGAALRAGHEELIFITTDRFNQRATQEFGEEERIKLVGGEKLLQMIMSLDGTVADDLLDLVVRDSEGWQTPTCPSCEIKMVMRTAAQTGKRFWGCTNYGKRNCLQQFRVKSFR